MAKILIIDDDQDIVESMKVVLESKGHQIVSAINGAEGYAKALEVSADVVILDLMMDYTTEGFDVAKRLKDTDLYKDIPILMLTAIKDKVGMDFKKEIRKEKWLSVDDYLEKPIEPKELLEKIESSLKR